MKPILTVAKDIANATGRDLKEIMYELTMELIREHIIPCVKLEMYNIVWPSWSAEEYEFDRRFHGAHYINNKEQGCYPYAPEYHPLCRIVGGELVDENGMLDAYAWTEEKFCQFATDVQPFGGNSGKGILNMCAIIPTIKNEHDRIMFAHRMAREKRDLLLVTTAAEDRRCVEITQELYDLGLTACIDQWVKLAPNGTYAITNLQVGDRLIIDRQVYCVRKDMYEKTYTDETMA